MTKITMEQTDQSGNTENCSRVVHSDDGNEMETWFELLPVFFDLLQGLGYEIDNPTELVKIVEDHVMEAHDGKTEKD